MRRPAASALAVLATAASFVLAVAGTASATPGVGQDFGFCPGPSALVHPHTHWSRRRLASGVTLSRARSHDAKGRLEISVLRVHLRNHNVHPVALRGSLSAGHPLSALARNRHVVAATNAMYFNFVYGAPKVPFVAERRAIVLSASPRPVAGIGIDHLAEAGDVWLKGQVRSDELRYPLQAVNAVDVPTGLTVYTAAWGPGRVPMPAGARTRSLRAGRVISGIHRTRTVPRDGELLVARGAVARSSLRSLAFGRPIRVSRHVATDAAVPFAQAYGTGTEVVAQRGQVQDDLFCQRSEFYAARTTIGWSHAGGQLLLVTVESPSGPDYHGVDENQMSGLMVALGATRAFALDGGGSTELLAREPTVDRVRIRRHVKHGHGRAARKAHFRVRTTWDLHKVAHGFSERRIPVGIGIYSRRVHKRTRWHRVR